MNEPIDKLDSKAARRALILGRHGSPEKQKDQLVDSILSAFENPDHWPMTQTEQCDLLRGLYRAAVRIREVR